MNRNDNGVLVVGSVAYDSVTTPVGAVSDVIGGSATYFSLSVSHFASVSLVAVVGSDFLQEHLDLFSDKGVETSGLEKVEGDSFRWSGLYSTEDVNERTTLNTDLNVFSEFSPDLTDIHNSKPYLFLANIQPHLQLSVLDQMKVRPRMVALDTMNFWIEGNMSELKEALSKADVVFMDEHEIRSFSAEVNIIRAAQNVMDLGPSTVVVKRGEHGVLMFQRDSLFSAPAFPVKKVVDPTGAGDSFAGGFVGYMAATQDFSQAGFRRAVILGSVMGSLAVESFGPDRVVSAGSTDIEKRFNILYEMTRFEPLGDGQSLPGISHF